MHCSCLISSTPILVLNSESNAPKWLGEDVPELSSCLDILEFDLSTVDAITDEVILGVDVLAPIVVDGVLR